MAITGGVDVARLVYAAQLGLVVEAYCAAEGARLGAVGASTDILDPDGYRTALLFQASMPELRNDLRFPRLRARLGLVEFWLATRRCPRLRQRGAYNFRAACVDVAQLPKDEVGF